MNFNCRPFLSAVSGIGLLCLTLTGCSQVERPEGMPELHPLVLSITQQGAPLEGVSVQLLPLESANARWASGGSSDATGQVVVKTLGQYEGAPAGKYKLTFYKTESEDTTPGVDPNDPGASKIFKSYQLIDPKYQSAESTPIEVDVSSGENSVPPIDLGAPVRIEQMQL